MQIVPLDNSPNQSFQITLTVNGVNITLGFFLSYNEVAKYWLMKISDPKTNTVILDAVPLVTDGTTGANLLAQYEYMKIGSAYLIKTTPSELDYPDDATLGTVFQLVWGDNVSYYTTSSVEETLVLIEALTSGGSTTSVIQLEGREGPPGIRGQTGPMDVIGVAVALAAQAAAEVAQAAAELAETHAELAEVNAEYAENLAMQWATNPEDDPVEGSPTGFSSYHWAQKAEDAEIASEAARDEALAYSLKASEWSDNPEDDPVEASPARYSAYHWSKKAEEAAASVTLPIIVSSGGTGLLTVTAGSYLKGNGTNPLVERTPAQVVTDLGLDYHVTDVWKAATVKTLSSGAFTPDQTLHLIATESGAATDDLTTIPMATGTQSNLLAIRADDAAKTIVIKETDNIYCGGSDVILDDVTKYVLFLCDRTLSKWIVVGGSGSGGGGASIPVHQTGHSFSVGCPVYRGGSPVSYVAADCTTAAKAEIAGIVSAVSGVDDFTLLVAGPVTVTDPSTILDTGSFFTDGGAYFLSATSGKWTLIPPAIEGYISKGFLLATSTTTANFFNMRGAVVGGGSASFLSTFTNAELSSGVLTATHNFGHQYCGMPTIIDNTGMVIIPDDVTYTGVNALTVDLSSYGTITGTWRIVILDSGAAQQQVTFATASEITTGTVADKAIAPDQLVASGIGRIWQVKTSAANAAKGYGYICDTTSAGFTLTLPATPAAGDCIAFKDGASKFGTNNLTIGRNGNKIMGLAEDMVVSVNNMGGELVYYDATNGWRL